MKHLNELNVVDNREELESRGIHITTSRMQMYMKLKIGELYLFGNIYIDKKKIEKKVRGKSIDDLVDYTMSQPGYFVAVFITEIKTIVWNDIFGNGRVYFSDQPSLVVFDDYKSRDKNNLDEIEFFKRKSYTSCIGTFDVNVHKLPPGNCLTINHKSREFQIVDRKHKIFSILKGGDYKLKDSISKVLELECDNKSENILMFTGGKDSFYLAKIMQEMSVKFRLCFIYYSNESSSDNITDLKAVYQLARYLDLPLDVIPFEKKDYEKAIDDAKNLRPLDYSFPAMYHATKVLKAKYGSIRLINGQSSDSLLCWGISGKGLSSFLQRFIISKYYFNSVLPVRYVLGRAIGVFYSLYHKKSIRYIIPSNKVDLMTALNAPSIYVPLWTNDKFFEYVKNVVVNKKEVTYDDLLVAKLNYLQGSSNQLVIGSASNADCEVVMPFLSPIIAVQAFYNKSDFLKLFFPRYEIQKNFTIKENLYFFGFSSILSHKKNHNKLKGEWLS